MNRKRLLLRHTKFTKALKQYYSLSAAANNCNIEFISSVCYLNAFAAVALPVPRVTFSAGPSASACACACASSSLPRSRSALLHIMYRCGSKHSPLPSPPPPPSSTLGNEVSSQAFRTMIPSVEISAITKRASKLLQYSDPGGDAVLPMPGSVLLQPSAMGHGVAAVLDAVCRR